MDVFESRKGRLVEGKIDLGRRSYADMFRARRGRIDEAQHVGHLEKRTSKWVGESLGGGVGLTLCQRRSEFEEQALEVCAALGSRFFESLNGLDDITASLLQRRFYRVTRIPANSSLRYTFDEMCKTV